MDEQKLDVQKPVWRTAWYWKRVSLYLLAPLCAACGILALLKAHHNLTQQECDRILTILSGLSPVAFAIWMNPQIQKRNCITNQ